MKLTDEQTKRIASETPNGGVAIPVENPLEIAAFRLPNGARHVVLSDESEATWENYCHQIAKSHN
jgi:hypothetical protein